LVFSCYLLAAYLTFDVAPDVFLIDEGGLWHIALVVGVIILGIYFHDLYEDFRIRSRILLFQQVSLVLGMAFVLQAALSYARSSYLLPKWLMVYGSVGVLLLLPAWRILFVGVVSKALGAQGILFLGSSQAVREIISHITQSPHLGLAALGYLDQDASAPEEICGVRLLGGMGVLQETVAEHKPDRIVVGMAERRNRLPMEQLLQLRLSGVHIEEAAATFETLFHRVSTRDLRPSQLIFSAELGPRPQSVALQSVYSWLLGLIGLVVTLPIMALVAVLVKLTSPGPALFRQTRVGLGGTTFMVFKFRSMYQDAEARTGAVWATRDDPRITPLGRWLRRLRLDELPQLFNVIRGEMSIVGPRPERPEFVAILQERIPYYVQRHCIKPGITGWAQINHKYSDTIEDSLTKLEFDLYYIKNLALSLDAYIIFHTAKIMLLGRGAQ
jgi:exopolysaccharide biosynthesis polyprenyl glycosylphosphotransferase